MVAKNDPLLPSGAMSESLFDAWLLPVTFWSEWWSFYVETLNVGRICAPQPVINKDETPVDVEVEEGLVA